MTRRTFGDLAPGERAYWGALLYERIADEPGLAAGWVSVRYVEDCGEYDTETRTWAIRAGTLGSARADETASDRPVK